VLVVQLARKRDRLASARRLLHSIVTVDGGGGDDYGDVASVSAQQWPLRAVLRAPVSLERRGSALPATLRHQSTASIVVDACQLLSLDDSHIVTRFNVRNTTTRCVQLVCCL
jgi:hypothetical protein